jgi:cell fate regulator YaaT (PSP1 superfamily)
MGCSNCSSGKNGTPSGCQNNGLCSSGGCNKLNTFDWLAKLDISDPCESPIIEVSFKNGSRKDFYSLQNQNQASTGDFVVVDTGNGYDVGKISLSGELVNLQLKKKRVPSDKIFNKVLRRAHDRDLQKLEEARSQEKAVLVRSRVIARTLGLEMKVGDVEFQGDKRKATFFYTADGRVDFRELVRMYAKEFKVKIEMRQIGSRQESGKIGGIGSCGRELCCSTWLTDFKSVSTTAARYQNIAINQSKLSGQCGRLKCCLNYELDTYMDALEDFPKNAEKIVTEVGTATLFKTDIFKGIMFYSLEMERGRAKVIALDKNRVKEILKLIKSGNKISELIPSTFENHGVEENEEMDFADVTGQIELPEEKRRKGRNNRNNRKNRNKKRSNRPGNRAKNPNQSSNSNKNSNPNRGNSNRNNPKKKTGPSNKPNNTEKRDQ